LETKLWVVEATVFQAGGFSFNVGNMV